MYMNQNKIYVKHILTCSSVSLCLFKGLSLSLPTNRNIHFATFHCMLAIWPYKKMHGVRTFFESCLSLFAGVHFSYLFHKSIIKKYAARFLVMCQLCSPCADFRIYVLAKIIQECRKNQNLAYF